MGKVLFYHLTRSSAEETLRTLLPRALSQGWPVMVRGGDAAALDHLDARLWQGEDEDFLPHGREGGPHDALQPVLIGTGAAVNGARAVALIDGAPADLDEARHLERLWVLFDAGNDARLQAARDLWRRVVAADLPAEYWSEESGRWQMKAGRGS